MVDGRDGQKIMKPYSPILRRTFGAGVMAIVTTREHGGKVHHFRQFKDCRTLARQEERILIQEATRDLDVMSAEQSYRAWFGYYPPDQMTVLEMEQAIMKDLEYDILSEIEEERCARFDAQESLRLALEADMDREAYDAWPGYGYDPVDYFQ
jgi:hypothetical protein